MVGILTACGELDIDSREAGVVFEGSPEARGILLFLNGPTATVDLLDKFGSILQHLPSSSILQHFSHGRMIGVHHLHLCQVLL